ncbi:ATP-binding protein [Streptomyces antarcticus]|uniref:ATP-binding protein n=1 Tax=Streptomyces antarcticus TaxID=2996458 RepID=UPI00226D7808|nr:ATP-binding protein [Streptomyces sp. H34-AA3]MCY0945654.1 ATP-binding protein [Streptomyces sp. H34-AA3]
MSQSTTRALRPRCQAPAAHGPLLDRVPAAPAIQGPDGYTPRDTAPSRARRDITLCLHTWGLDHLVDDARLIVSELVTNAIRHTRTGRIGVSVTRHPDRVRIVVTDTSRTTPAPPNPDPDAEAGRGLQLIDQLSTGWGSERLTTGKRVWAELATSEAPS